MGEAPWVLCHARGLLPQAGRMRGFRGAPARRRRAGRWATGPQAGAGPSAPARRWRAGRQPPRSTPVPGHPAELPAPTRGSRLGTFPQLLSAPGHGRGSVLGWFSFPWPISSDAVSSAGAEGGFCRQRVRREVHGRGEERTHAGSKRAHLKRVPCPLVLAGGGLCDHTRASRLATRYIRPSAESRAGGRRRAGNPLVLTVPSHPQARPTSGSARAFFSRGWDPAGTALGIRSTRCNAPSARICDQFRAERDSWLLLSRQRCLNALLPCRGCSQYQPPPSRKLLDTAI